MDIPATATTRPARNVWRRLRVAMSTAVSIRALLLANSSAELTEIGIEPRRKRESFNAMISGRSGQEGCEDRIACLQRSSNESNRGVAVAVPNVGTNDKPCRLIRIEKDHHMAKLEAGRIVETPTEARQA